VVHLASTSSKAAKEKHRTSVSAIADLTPTEQDVGSSLAMIEQSPPEAVRPILKGPLIPSSRVGYIAMTVARLFLGLAMVPYAIDKLLAYQFKIPAWSYAQPLGATSGSTLAWATFGYSPRLQMLLGLFELIPALLLLNARTRRLGALIMLPVLLNVALINFSLDLWSGTKTVSFTCCSLTFSSFFTTVRSI
jgi:hypothetical protein